jgi:uncharacterized membrane protein
MNRDHRAARTLIGATVAAAALLGGRAARADESAPEALAEEPAPVVEEPGAQASKAPDEGASDEAADTKPADEPVKTRKRRGLLIGGAITLPVGAIFASLGIYFAASSAERSSSSSSDGALGVSFDFDGSGSRVFNGMVIGIGSVAMIAGGVMLGASQIPVPVAVKPGVAGNPGLTFEAQF